MRAEHAQPLDAPGARDASPWRDLPRTDGVERARAVGADPEPAAAGSPYAFTIAVCTYRRPESLMRFLASLAGQARAASLLVVDASDDDRTERALEAWDAPAALADYVAYYRVSAARRGVTRQRNFALARTRTPLVAFFDDDVVLLPGCLRALVEAHQRGGPSVAGVGAAIDNEPARPAVWRARHLLRVVPSLTPGRYFRSGFSTPWGYVAPGDTLHDGDWLPGGATMWKTADARAVGFEEALGGYGCGNDLAFSLRIASRGRQVLSAGARVLHLHESSGRPDPRAMGYEAAQNAHAIHRAAVPPGTMTRLWFAYATVADLALAATGLLRVGRTRATAEYLRGAAGYWLSRRDARPTLPSNS